MKWRSNAWSIFEIVKDYAKYEARARNLFFGKAFGFLIQYEKAKWNRYAGLLLNLTDKIRQAFKLLLVTTSAAQLLEVNAQRCWSRRGCYFEKDCHSKRRISRRNSLHLCGGANAIVEEDILFYSDKSGFNLSMMAYTSIILTWNFFLRCGVVVWVYESLGPDGSRGFPRFLTSACSFSNCSAGP